MAASTSHDKQKIKHNATRDTAHNHRLDTLPARLNSNVAIMPGRRRVRTGKMRTYVVLAQISRVRAKMEQVRSLPVVTRAAGGLRRGLLLR